MLIFRYTGKAKDLDRELAILEKCHVTLKEIIRLKGLKNGGQNG